MQDPQSKVEIRDFLGLQLGTEPHSIPPGGAQDQVNCFTVNAGSIQSRGGLKLASTEWSTFE